MRRASRPRRRPRGPCQDPGPVLSTTGEFDEVGPKVEAHAKLIPGAKFVLYRDAGHVSSRDARDANVKDVREFLRSVDQR